MKHPTEKTQLLRLGCAITIALSFASCSLGYIDRAVYEEITHSRLSDPTIRLQADAHGVFCHRDGGRASVYLTTTAHHMPKIKAVRWRTDGAWHDVETANIRSESEGPRSGWRVTIPLGVVFEKSGEASLELNMQIQHQGQLKNIARHYHVRREQMWHGFNILFDIT